MKLFKNRPSRLLFSFFLGLSLGFLFGSAYGHKNVQKAELFCDPVDTLHIQEPPEVIRGKKALIIGDSHSAYAHGWQTFLVKWTGIKIRNISIEGKDTDWMRRRLPEVIDTSYDFCFIYGGGNDAAGGKNPRHIFQNIQQMVDLCNKKGVRAIVITGSSAEKLLPSTPRWSTYIRTKRDFQKILTEELQSATLVDVRYLIEKQDCADVLCHMQVSGHKKIANEIINCCNFYRVVD
jgi:hypothetical protein